MKKILTYSLLTAGLIGTLGVGAASAQGWFGFGHDATPEEIAQKQEVMFQKKADFLGISVDEVKDAWAEGKNFREIAEEHGITPEQIQERTQEARELKQDNMEAHLQALIDDGIITQEQADQKIQRIQDKFKDGQMRKGFYSGYGKCFE